MQRSNQTELHPMNLYSRANFKSHAVLGTAWDAGYPPHAPAGSKPAAQPIHQAGSRLSINQPVRRLGYTRQAAPHVLCGTPLEHCRPTSCGAICPAHTGRRGTDLEMSREMRREKIKRARAQRHGCREIGEVACGRGLWLEAKERHRQRRAVLLPLHVSGFADRKSGQSSF